jgi:hypothetical protein
MMAGQEFEPEEAVLVALKESAVLLQVNGEKIQCNNVLISDLKGVLKQHYDLNLRSYQIKEVCIGLGFKVVTTGNYPKVKVDSLLMDKLLEEKGLVKKN